MHIKATQTQGPATPTFSSRRVPAWRRTVATALVFACPALLVGVHREVNVVFFVLLLLLAPGIFTQAASRPRWFWLYASAMAGPTAAILLSQAANGDWAWPAYDAASRFLFAVPLFLALRELPASSLRMLRPGVVVGAILAALMVLVAPHPYGEGRVTGGFLNPIYFGDFSVDLAVLVAFGIDWNRHEPDKMRLLGWLATGAAIYASARTGSRGGWLALLVVMPWLAAGRQAARTRGRGLGALLLAGGFACLLPEVRARMAEVYGNLAAFAHGNADTSIGIRLQLWRYALHLYATHPLFGIGADGWRRALPRGVAEGWLTPRAAHVGRGEVHNEWLGWAVRDGIFGVGGLFAVYVVPFALFWRRLRCGDGDRAARMGMALIGAQVVCGLSVETFDLTMTTAFYALVVAVLLAAAYPGDRQRESVRKAL